MSISPTKWEMVAQNSGTGGHGQCVNCMRKVIKKGAKMKKKVLKVSGNWDGNAFAIVGNTKRALRDAGVPQEKIGQVFDECTRGDYIHLIAICMSALAEAGYEVR